MQAVVAELLRGSRQQRELLRRAPHAHVVLGESADAAVDTLKQSNCGDAEFLDSLFLWKTPQVDCGDDRGEVCIDYSEWTQAWTESAAA